MKSGWLIIIITLIIIIFIVLIVLFETKMQEIESRLQQCIRKDHLLAQLETLFNKPDTLASNDWKQEINMFRNQITTRTEKVYFSYKKNSSSRNSYWPCWPCGGAC